MSRHNPLARPDGVLSCRGRCRGIGPWGKPCLRTKAEIGSEVITNHFDGCDDRRIVSRGCGDTWPPSYQQKYRNGRETDDDEFERDEANPEVRVGGLADTKLGDCALWVEACNFFRHYINDKETGVRLPGLTLAFRPHQIVDCYKTLRQCDSTKFNGTLNASKPSLGKTFEVLMVAATIALAHLSKKHYDEHPEDHLAQGEGVCALGDPFGIMCFCVTDSRFTSGHTERHSW